MKNRESSSDEIRLASEKELLRSLEGRLGRVYARQRLGIETDHETQILGQERNFFHIESWYSIDSVIRHALMLCGLYWRGRRNAERITVKTNSPECERLPASFDGFTILHISDTHVDMNQRAMRRLAEIVSELEYDLCVLTGDFRGKSCGPYQQALAGMAELVAHLRPPIYGVLGNHDTIRMLPGLEAAGIKMLQNECTIIERGTGKLYLAGIDDAHYFRVDNIEKAAAEIPEGAFSVLLSHTPEIYRQAANAGFDLLLSGHTHGGQICLPGSRPITLDSVLPRRMGAGPWRFGRMQGYTSVGAGSSKVAVRFNCPPEITLHRFQRVAFLNSIR